MSHIRVRNRGRVAPVCQSVGCVFISALYLYKGARLFHQPKVLHRNLCFSPSLSSSYLPLSIGVPLLQTDGRHEPPSTSAEGLWHSSATRDGQNGRCCHLSGCDSCGTRHRPSSSGTPTTDTQNAVEDIRSSLVLGSSHCGSAS